MSIRSGAEELSWYTFDICVKVCYEYLDGSNRTKDDGEIFFSQRTREQIHPQGTCEYASGQCDFTFHHQELTQEIQVRRSFLRRWKTIRKTSDFFGPDSSALSEEISYRKCSSNSREFLSASGYHQKYSWSGTGFEKIQSQMGGSFPIGWTKFEKSEGIPKSVDYPRKLCGEIFSENHCRK
jgi:hypothetical protein